MKKSHIIAIAIIAIAVAAILSTVVDSSTYASLSCGRRTSFKDLPCCG